MGTSNNTSNKTSILTSIIAAICILIYIAALSFGAVRIILNIGERRNFAKAEFDIIVDRASTAAVFLGFMSEQYQQAINDSLISTSTPLLGIIITGPSGTYAFERTQGSGIVWSGNTPHLRTGAGYPGVPLHQYLRIDGQRGMNIYAVYSSIDYNYFISVLRDTLFAILIALAAALITLTAELIFKKRTVSYNISPIPDAINPNKNPNINPAIEPIFDSHTLEKLNTELHHSAKVNMDLCLFSMEIPDFVSELEYADFYSEASDFFNNRDMVYKNGKNGVHIIVPGMEMEKAMERAEDFQNIIIARIPFSFFDRSALLIGLSTRQGRSIDAQRLMLEADTALQKVKEDPAYPIVAFKSDPDKYREFVKKTRRQ